jgi:hypothetical protein
LAIGFTLKASDDAASKFQNTPIGSYGISALCFKSIPYCDLAHGIEKVTERRE